MLILAEEELILVASVSKYSLGRRDVVQLQLGEKGTELST